ncbi:conserved hypothetical protein [Coccidioides posadasii str. Silveira]|uniref:Uncharacterized protein n=1 Tax=Coccidioides posadasii (strain RMSCC 757 / Silveira) TaxID=443226 RepID=E9DB77_COCPS|nr:conserved hypothetical protein [Coccidioides posadasii str. Silveira]
MVENNVSQYQPITYVPGPCILSMYAKPGDKTGFCHINVNVPDAITTGRDINMIQGFLILTAEEPSNCTEILPGMHNYLENWWGLVERGTMGCLVKVGELVDMTPKLARSNSTKEPRTNTGSSNEEQ